MKKLNAGNKQAFTLVELIVVITILIILWTIAFISLEWYSKNSRDWVRVADVNSARKSLELFITEKWFYPIPDNPTNIIYSGATAWIQWTIWDGVIRNLDKIDKKIVDPLTETEYTYSVTSSKTEYQIWTITEWWAIGYELPINQTHAATDKKATAMIRGTYNERFLRVQSWSLNWMLAIPSIITTDLTQTDVQTILTENKLVYNNYQNIPHSYNNAWYTMTGWFNYTNTDPLIYSGSLKSLTESNQSKLDFITKLKEAYEWTILHWEANYKDIVNAEPSNQTGSIYLVNRFINTNLWWIKVSNIILPTSWTLETLPTYNCTWSLVTENADIRNTGGLTEDTIYQDDNLTGSCYYTCKNWYTWDDCNIPPVTFLSNCTSNLQFIYTDSIWIEIWRVDSVWAAISWNPWALTCEWNIIVCSSNNAWYILQACNLWTTIVWTWASSYWNYFQWWNNWWIPSWTITPSTTVVNTTTPITYWPGNYYNVATFIWLAATVSPPNDWSNPQNNNLWWSGWTAVQRQWPCAIWYHIPTQPEWASIIAYGWWSSASWTNDWTRMMNSLRLPMAGSRYHNVATFVYNQGTSGDYWSTSPNSTNAYSMYMNTANVGSNNSSSRAQGLPIRCVKN